MRKKPPVPFTKKFPGVEPMALNLLKHLLSFDPKERPSAAEVRVGKTYICSLQKYILHPKLLPPQLLTYVNVLQGP